jgi:hypothetical protein
MSRWLVGAVLAVGCYRSTPGAPVEPVEAAARAAAITMLPGSVGPLTAQTRATLIALRETFIGFEVRPANARLGEIQHLGYHVYRDGERLLYVMPDDKGAITNVHALSAKVAIADHAWRIGAPFNGVKALSTCKCWEDEVVVCWKNGEHVAVAFARACTWESFGSADDRQDLIGAPIQRVLWSPRPYAIDSNPFGGNGYGGGDEYDDL